MPSHQKTTTPLETALVAAAFDPSSRPFFYRNLQDFDAYVASRKSPSPSSRISFIRIPRDSSGDGRPHVAVFSSPEMVPKEFSPVKIKLGELFRVVRGTPVSLNPDQAATKDFSVEEIESILSGELSLPASPRPLDQWEPPSPAFRPPSGESEECWDAVRALLKDHPSISSAWAAELGNSSPPAVAVWLESEDQGSMQEAAAECRLMLSTLSSPPPSIIVRPSPPPPPAKSIFP